MNENPNPTNASTDEQHDLMVDLLIQRATTGISEGEQQELDQLALLFDNPAESDRFEATAAAFDLSIASVEYEAMPSDVHDRLLISAGKFLGDQQSQSAAVAISSDGQATSDLKVELSKRNDSAKFVRWREIVAITVAAASLLLMLSGYNPFAQTVKTPVASAFVQMDQFIAANPTDLVDTQWNPEHNKDVGGKVIWSDSRQEGYMVFSGMAMNDPSVEQYQLWIFDNDLGQAAPTNGGVFDISKADIGPDGNVVIPIKASVPVDHAVQFAVTIETPGGVYVSDRKRLPVLATIDGDK